MMWQLIIVGAIVSAAMMLTTIRVFRFFTTPPSKCHGCSGCKLQELKKNS
ncbi:MAG: FeoB-associated Cys-rich membrane protein [Bacteroidetes bacterium]|nr:FeoB-associated Cys-rich membrane protein [Bacteroidota bacterium]